MDIKLWKKDRGSGNIMNIQQKN